MKFYYKVSEHKIIPLIRFEISLPFLGVLDISLVCSEFSEYYLHPFVFCRHGLKTPVLSALCPSDIPFG